MEIQCEHCGTVYLFDESRATGERMRFKCSKCGNVFELQVSAPKSEEEQPDLSKDTLRIDMQRRLEELEEKHTIPDRSPIIVEGVIGAEEAGLTEPDLSRIEIGAPSGRPSLESRISRRSRGGIWQFAPVLLIAAGVGAIIGFGIYLFGSSLIPGLADFLPFGTQRASPPAQQSAVQNLALISVEGFFSRNNVAGHIYVLKGKVDNRGAKPCRDVRLKGVLYNKEGNPVMESAVSCGIDIADRDLATLPVSEIHARMTGRPPGGADVLQPSQSLPFTLVFVELPKDIYEYSVSIIGADSLS